MYAENKDDARRPTSLWVCLLGDTHGVVTLADQGLPVVIPLGPDGDELQRVGPGAELPVGQLHPPAGAVGQVNAAYWVLVRGGNKDFKMIIRDYVYN